MGEQIKLEEPGDEYTMKIAEVLVDDSGQWPSVRFVDENGDYIKMTGKTAEAKLKRLTFTVNSLNALAQKEAVWMEFRRDENPNRGQSPYWSVELAEKRRAAGQQARANGGTTNRAPAPASTRSAASQGQPEGKASPSGNHTPPTQAKPPIGPVYLECLEFVLKEVLPRWAACPAAEKMGAPTWADVNAAVATLFIRTEKQPGPLMPQPVNSRRPAEPPPPTDDDYDPSLYDDEPGDR